MDFTAEHRGGVDGQIRRPLPRSRRLEYTYKIVEFRPDERLVMRTLQGPFPMETTYAWSAVDDRSTRMTLSNQGEPAGFARITARAMQRAMRRANTKDLQNLERILECAPRG